MARRRKRKAAADENGDFSIQLNPIPGAPNPTMELETADLQNMEQHGEAIARPNLVIQLESGRTVELGPGWSQKTDDSPKIIIDDGLAPPKPVATPAPSPTIPLPKRDRGGWLVAIVYVLATAALAAALYERYLL